MKLLGSTKNKKDNDKNCEKVPHLEITEVVVFHCDIVNNEFKQKLKSFVYICSK